MFVALIYPLVVVVLLTFHLCPVLTRLLSPVLVVSVSDFVVLTFSLKPALRVSSCSLDAGVFIV